MTWKHLRENNYLCFLGITFFFIGLIDIMHMLSFKGMGIFKGDRGFRFDKLSAAAGKKKLLSSAEETLVRRGPQTRLAGQGTLPFDSGDVEDQNALIFTETFKGKGKKHRDQDEDPAGHRPPNRRAAAQVRADHRRRKGATAKRRQLLRDCSGRR